MLIIEIKLIPIAVFKAFEKPNFCFIKIIVSSITGERYLPSAAIRSLTAAEYAATTRAKRRDKKKGKQFSKQPKAIAKKTRRFRFV